MENHQNEASTPETQQYANDHLQLTVERKTDCIIEYHASVDSKIALQSYAHAIKSIAKEVSIPGFRKGKAPEEIIRKKYQQPVDEKWQKQIADQTFKQCQELTKIPLLGPDAPVSFTMKEHSQAGAKMDFSFETEPSVPAIKLDAVTLSEPEKKEVNDKKIEDTVHQIRMFFAKWEKITDRPVEEGDFLIIDLTVTEEDPPRPVFNNTRVEVHREKMAKWMFELVLGKHVGQSLEGVSQPDEDASAKEKEEMPPKKVMVVVKAIERANMPEVNDEFAKKVGAENVEQMKQRLKELLEKQAAEDRMQKLRDQLSKKLVDTCSFDLPKSLINKETTHRLRSMLQNQSFLNDWKSKNEEERKHEQQKVQEEAKQAVRLFYISKKILSDAKIQITEEEIRPRITTPLEAMFTDPSILQYDQKSEEEKALTMSRLMLAKAENHLIDQLEKQNLITKPSKST